MRLPALLLTVPLLALAACGEAARTDAEESPSPTDATTASPTQTSTLGDTAAPGPSPTASPTERAGRATEITTFGSQFGQMLFDGTGQAIYLFDKETTATPDCYAECAEAWPPVLTEGDPRATGRVRAGLLGTTERRDGSLQVTYAGHPLYYYAHERKRQVLCHDVEEYGGLWLVVQPDGDPAPTT